MRIQEITQQIETAIQHERRTGTLRAALVRVAHFHGKSPTGAELDEVVRFCTEYVQHVPVLMAATQGLASKHGMSSVGPLLSSCESYWVNGFDIIPDHQGLLGLVDDAYYTLTIIERISESHRQRTNVPLFDLPLREANASMRQLIGEPHATMLDSHVQAALGAPAFMGLLTQLFQGMQFATPIVDRDPIWGNASTEEIVKVQMGAMGIV